jgi:uncharacterized membrane protein YhaH (DUF805 family)
MFFLVNFLIIIGINFLDKSLGIYVGIGFGLISSLYALAVTIPALAVGTRRLHDTGRSGWWFLIALIPLIGFIVLIVLLAGDSIPDNKHDSNPNFITTIPTPPIPTSASESAPATSVSSMPPTPPADSSVQ